MEKESLESLQKRYAEAYLKACGRPHKTPEKTLQDREFLERMIEYLKDKIICID